MMEVSKNERKTDTINGCYFVYKDGTKTKKQAIQEACMDADIYEVDVKENKKEALYFGYFNRINSSYQKTLNDPYYNQEDNKRKSEKGG